MYVFQSREIKFCDFKKKFRDGSILDIFYFQKYLDFWWKKNEFGGQIW